MVVETLIAWFGPALAGALGQLLRVSYGLGHAIKNGEAVDKPRLFNTLMLAIFSGATVGLFYNDVRLAFAAGFITTDAVEGIVKVLAKGERNV